MPKKCVFLVCKVINRAYMVIYLDIFLEQVIMCGGKGLQTKDRWKFECFRVLVHVEHGKCFGVRSLVCLNNV